MSTIMTARKENRKFLTSPRVPTVTEVNKNWIIRYSASDDRPGWHKLTGAGQYARKFGQYYADLHFTKAMDSGLDLVTFKIRGLWTITFIAR